VQDFRYAVRMLAKSPGFAVIAILTLALGIGANTSIFTVANALLLRPLPYSAPDQLVLISASATKLRAQVRSFSYPRYEQISQRIRSLSGISGFTNEVFNLTGRGDPEQLLSARVSYPFFDVLGVRPLIGRTFRADEDQPGGKLVVIISHGLWTRRFGGARDVIGQSVTLDSRDYTIIGVMPAGFQFALLGSAIDVWAPRVFELNLVTPEQIRAGAGFLNAVGRLKPDASIEHAQAELNVLTREYQHEHPGFPDADPDLTVNADNLQQQLVANVRPALLILLGAVGFLLLIACSNVASLLLARAFGRRKEIAVRTALGAARKRIIRQLLTESVILGIAGGILGLLVSVWGVRAIAAAAEQNLPRAGEIHIDWRVLAFTAGVSVLTGILFGLMPSIQLSRPDLGVVLRDEGRGASVNRSRTRARDLLVVVQVALSMILLVGCGLLVRSFLLLESSGSGVDPNGVLTMGISLPPAKYGSAERIVTYYDEVLNQVRSVPSVQAAAISSALPVNPSRFTPVLIEGQPNVPLGQRPVVAIETMSPDYPRVMRIPLLRGRTFTNHDDSSAALVAMVNQALARRYWPNEDPIGKKLWLGRRPEPNVVIGVLGDVKNIALATEPQPEIVLPFPQLPWALLNLSVRTTGDPHRLIPAIRAELLKIDKDQPITGVQTMEELLRAAGAQPRQTMLLLGIFSATAFVLAVVGIYGMIAYAVAQRTQELGIRVALGAARGDILRLVIGHGMAIAFTGIVLGTLAALALTRVMSSQLYQISATDPLTFSISAVLFVLVALAASYIPARRAARIDPSDALRYE
jgi:putative ABC transport system permease protein